MTMDFSAVVDTRRATRVTTQVGCRPSGLVILEGDEEEVRNCLTLKFVWGKTSGAQRSDM